MRQIKLESLDATAGSMDSDASKREVHGVRTYTKDEPIPNQAFSSLVVPHCGMVNLTSTTRIK